MVIDRIVMTEDLCTEFDLVSVGNCRRYSSKVTKNSVLTTELALHLPGY